VPFLHTHTCTVIIRPQRGNRVPIPFVQLHIESGILLDVGEKTRVCFRVALIRSKTRAIQKYILQQPEGVMLHLILQYREHSFSWPFDKQLRSLEPQFSILFLKPIVYKISKVFF
jgi:hypothetical protein